LGSAWVARAAVRRRVLESDAELFYVYGTPDRTTGLGLFSWPSKYWSTERQWIADASASGLFTLGGREHQLMFGVNWSSSDSALRSSDDNLHMRLPPLETWVSSFPVARPAFDHGVTGQADFLDRRRSVYAGARLTLTDRINVITATSVTHANSDGQQYGQPHAYSRTKASPYLGAVYEFDARHSVYTSYTQIFNPQSQIDEFHAVLPPIEGRTVEVGAKSEWLGGRVNGTAAVFRAAQRNTAEYAGFADGASYYKPVDGTSTGLEFEADGLVTRGWHVSAGYTRFKLVGDDGEDIRTFVPRSTFRVSSTYQVAGLEALTLGATVNWQGDAHRVQGVDPEGNDIVSRQAAYALANLMARYGISRTVSATLHVNNVANTKYYGSLYWPQNYYGAPRHAALTLNYRF
ncbi:MAG: TonB-dependent siderophore receptor, partial [Steroidobacteraceae bacterium]